MHSHSAKAPSVKASPRPPREHPPAVAVLHPNAAGTDAHSDMHMVCVPADSVVIEACSQDGGARSVRRTRVRCDVANTAGAAWAWKNVKCKTDRDDALKLARLSSRGELPTVMVLASAVRQRKSLIALRKGSWAIGCGGRTGCGRSS